MNPYEFFHQWAGFSWDPKTETREQGKARCAQLHATAEAWARDAGVRFQWVRDPDCDRSGIEHGGPLWLCMAWRDSTCIGSLGSVDLGESGEPWGDPYARVIEAELALTIMPPSPTMPAQTGWLTVITSFPDSTHRVPIYGQRPGACDRGQDSVDVRAWVLGALVWIAADPRDVGAL